MQKDYTCSIVILQNLALYDLVFINNSKNNTLYKPVKYRKESMKLCEKLRISSNIAYASLRPNFRYLGKYETEGHESSVKNRCN